MMAQTLFDGFNGFLVKHYGQKCSLETFKRFVSYCQKGDKVDGVTPMMNPINLYAFGKGITSKEASDMLFKREGA